MSKEIKIVVREGNTIAVEDIGKVVLDSEKYLTDYNFIQKEFSHVLGQILTIVDASVVGSQNKAIKDLIRQVFAEKYCYLTETLHSKEWLERVSTITDESEIEEVTLEDEINK